jgi:HlyD family secretion protein
MNIFKTLVRQGKKIIPIFETAKKYAFAHPFMSAAAVLVVLGLGWWGGSAMMQGSAQTRYVLGSVERGTVIASISGSGQVSALRQVDMKPEVSGTVVYVAVKAGNTVKKGQLLVQIDSTDAQKALRDAQNNLETAKLNLEKLLAPASGLSLIQAQNAVSNAEDSLAKAYVTGQNDITEVFLDMPDLMTSLKDIVIGTSASRGSQWNIDYYQNAIANYDEKVLVYRNNAYESFVAAQAAYDASFVEYKAMSNSPSTMTIEEMTQKTYDAVKKISEALKSVNTFVLLYSNTLTNRNQTPASVATAALTTLASDIQTTNSTLSALLSDTSSFKSGKQSLVEKRETLEDLVNGPDELDVRSDTLTVGQREDAVLDAQQTLAKYYIRAPFDGSVASVDVYAGDSAGSASVVSLITPQQMATLSLNEVDAAKVVVGNKATLTFDAIEDLTLTGTVVQIDAVGTVSQGVVSYEIKIAFDSQDARIKPGMTVNAVVQTVIKQDVLRVPTSAVKTQNGVSYVQVFDPALKETGGTQGIAASVSPTRVEVEVGISDDANIEIISGLTEGQQVVTRTITGSSAKTTTSPSQNAFGGSGGIRL